MIRTAYNTAHTQSGAKIETFLASVHGPGYIKISEPICMNELLESCKYSDLNIYSSAHGLKVDPRVFDDFGGVILWSERVDTFSAPTFKVRNEYGREFRAWFEAQQTADGTGIYLIAFTDLPTPNGPTIRVQLDVEFD